MMDVPEYFACPTVDAMHEPHYHPADARVNDCRKSPRFTEAQLDEAHGPTGWFAVEPEDEGDE